MLPWVLSSVVPQSTREGRVNADPYILTIQGPNIFPLWDEDWNFSFLI